MTDMIVRPMQTCGDSGGKDKHGNPCGALLGLSPDTGLCRAHDPATREEFAAKSKESGQISAIVRRTAREIQNTARPEDMPTFPPDTYERIARWHEWAIDAVTCGKIGTKTASEITKALKEQRAVLEKVGLERQLREIQAELGRYKLKHG